MQPKAKKTQFLTKEKMQGIVAAPGIVKKRKLAEQLFNSPQYKAQSQKKNGVRLKKSNT